MQSEEEIQSKRNKLAATTVEIAGTVEDGMPRLNFMYDAIVKLSLFFVAYYSLDIDEFFAQHEASVRSQYNDVKNDLSSMLQEH